MPIAISSSSRCTPFLGTVRNAPDPYPSSHSTQHNRRQISNLPYFEAYANLTLDPDPPALPDPLHQHHARSFPSHAMPCHAVLCATVPPPCHSNGPRPPLFPPSYLSNQRVRSTDAGFSTDLLNDMPATINWTNLVTRDARRSFSSPTGQRTGNGFLCVCERAWSCIKRGSWSRRGLLGF